MAQSNNEPLWRLSLLCVVWFLFIISSVLGLAMTKRGELVVVDALYSNARIHIFQQNGAIDTYPYQPLRCRYDDSKCRFLAVHGEEVLTSDLGKRHVKSRIGSYHNANWMFPLKHHFPIGSRIQRTLQVAHNTTVSDAEKIMRRER